MIYAAVVVAAVVPFLVGVLVLVRSAQRRVGGLLLAHGVSIGVLLWPAPASGTARWMVAADQLTQGAWIFFFLWLVLITYLLPDGTIASRFWRIWVAVGLVGVVLFTVGAAGDAQGFAQTHDGRPLVVPWLGQDVSGTLGLVGLALVVPLVFGPVVAVGSRLRRAVGDARLQLLWLVWGALSIPVALLILWGNHFILRGYDWITYPTLAFASVGLPVTIATAILKHRLFDIRLVLSRTLTFGVLTVGVVAIYGLALVATDRLLGSNVPGGAVAVAVVAVVIQPTATRVRRRIERWVYGYRSAPHEALRLLADRAEAAEPEALSASITAAVAEALRVDRVWISPDGATPGLRVPLVHRGHRLGDLAVEVPPGRDFSPADLSLFNDLARYAAVLVHAGRLTADLLQSRSRLVTAREEERRRLRRDLHDGVGPSLAAIVLTLNAAQARDDATERNTLLAEARDEVRAAIIEVRRVVDDLRPPAIDEVGLVGAIRQRAAALSGVLTVTVDAPETLLPLPAAVEVAAYRIASEAMTNVARHSGASHCQVTIELNGALQLTITDDGRGPAAHSAHGLGLSSMRERAAELGGSCTISARPGSGVVVRAVLPLFEAPDPDLETAS